MFLGEAKQQAMYGMLVFLTIVVAVPLLLFFSLCCCFLAFMGKAAKSCSANVQGNNTENNGETSHGAGGAPGAFFNNPNALGARGGSSYSRMN